MNSRIIKIQWHRAKAAQYRRIGKMKRANYHSGKAAELLDEQFAFERVQQQFDDDLDACTQVYGDAR